MTVTQINPYQPPGFEPKPQSRSLDQPLKFQGSITLDEAYEADGLLRSRGKPDKPPRPIRFRPLLDAVVLLGIGFLILDTYLQGDVEHFRDLCLGIAMVGVVLWATHYGPQRRAKKLAKLKNCESGLFSQMRGELDESGVRFYAADDLLPVEYVWGDYVGYRSSDNMLLLYVAYPGDVNPVGASYFACRGDWELAKQTVETKLNRIPRNARQSRYKPNPQAALFLKATRQLTAERWQDAADSFEELLTTDPGNAQALRGHASASCLIGEFDKALASANRLLESWPHDTNTRRLLTSILLGLERYADAEPILSELLNQHPDDGDMLGNRSKVYCELGRFNEALQDAERLLQLDQNDVIGHNNRGRCLIELGRPAEAISSLELAIKLAPNIPNPREHLARARSMLDEN